MRNKMLPALVAACIMMVMGNSAAAFPAEQGRTVYATASENAVGDGSSESSPIKLSEALKNASPGDEIRLLPGTYECSASYKIQTSGSQDSPIRLMADGAVLDFSGHPSHASLDADDDGYEKKAGITLSGSYWDISGITIERAPGVGMHIEGSCNTVSGCEFYANRDTGLQISGSPDGTYANWAHDNYILNCTSHHNYDDFRPKYGEDADGFAAKVNLGYGNVFDGCIAYCNSDDGWDLFAKDPIHPDGVCTIVNCIAFRNGYLEEAQTSKNGDGNGFKLGSADWAVPNRIKNCIAFENMAHGFTDNNNTAPIELVNCTSFDNNIGSSKDGNTVIGGKRNFQFNLEKNGETSGILSVYSSGYGLKQKCSSDKAGKYTDNLNGTIADSVIYDQGSCHIGETVAISSGTSVGTRLDTELDESIFESASLPAWGSSAGQTMRDEAGYISLKELFKVKDGAYASTGADLSGGRDCYQRFTTPEKNSDDYNDVDTERVNLGSKFMVFGEYEVNGGKFTSNTVFDDPKNPYFTVIVKSSMTLGNAGTEKDILVFTDDADNSYVPIKRLETKGNPEVENGVIVGRAVQFKVEDKATVTAYAMAGDRGRLTVFKEDGSVYDLTQEITMRTDRISPCVFSVYEPGTYYLGTEDTGTGFIYAVSQKDGEVAKEKSGPVKKHATDAVKLLAAKSASPDEDVLSLDDGYFTVGGAKSVASKDSGKAAELPKNGAGYVAFTIGSRANVLITAASTGGSNTSEPILERNGSPVAEDNGVSAVTGVKGTLLSYSGLEAGDYRFYCSDTRAIRFIDITVLEEATDEDLKDDSSSSGKDDFSGSGKDDSSSSGKDGSSSSGKDGSSGSSKPADIRQRVLDAISANKSSLDEAEIEVRAVSSGKKTGYEAVITPVSGNEIKGTLTMARGDKVALPGYDKKTASLTKDPTKCVAVNGKGVVTAKKATSGAEISYSMGGSRVTLKIVVEDVSLLCGTVSQDSAAPQINKLKVHTATAGSFDIILKAPIRAKAMGANAKGGITIDETASCIRVNEKGELHISGSATGKGSATIPFTVYGKKYTIKIKSK